MSDEVAVEPERTIRLLQDEVDQARREVAEVHDQLDACRRFSASQAERNVDERERAAEVRRQLDALIDEHETAVVRLAAAQTELASVTGQLSAIRRSRTYRWASAANRVLDRARRVLRPR
jgi:hypothetical protein